MKPIILASFATLALIATPTLAAQMASTTTANSAMPAKPMAAKPMAKHPMKHKAMKKTTTTTAKTN